jgi:hypothetical protein
MLYRLSGKRLSKPKAKASCACLIPLLVAAGILFHCCGTEASEAPGRDSQGEIPIALRPKRPANAEGQRQGDKALQSRKDVNRGVPREKKTPVISLTEGAKQASGRSGGNRPSEEQASAALPRDGAKRVPVIEVTKEHKISAKVENRPLNEVLRMMSDMKLFDIKGALPSGEPLSANFTDLCLDQALKKMMRGYNYALMDQGTSQKPLLMVMGRIERAKSSEVSPPQPPPPSSNQAPDPKTYYVPPTTVEPPAAVARKAPLSSAQPDATTPGPPGAQAVEQKKRQQQEAEKETPSNRQGIESEARLETETQGEQMEPPSDQAQPPGPGDARAGDLRNRTTPK